MELIIVGDVLRKGKKYDLAREKYKMAHRNKNILPELKNHAEINLSVFGISQKRAF